VSYGVVKEGYGLPIESFPASYIKTQYYPSLQKIYTAIEQSRGYTNFIGSKNLPPVDYYIPETGLIIEFDEIQHFTIQRKISLEHYPPDLGLGFSSKDWIALCESIQARDNDPFDRDERRAWYDTLRDFAPTLLNHGAIIRVYEHELQWCALNPMDPTDVQKFKLFLEDKLKLKNDDKVTNPAHWIATVSLESNLQKDLSIPDKAKSKNPNRKKCLNSIINDLSDRFPGKGIILFPGGWFNTDSARVSTYYSELENEIKEIFQGLSPARIQDFIVCIGLDGYIDSNGFDRDQVAMAINSEGIIALGRKFYPSGEEREKAEICKADSHIVTENGYHRIFTFDGISHYMAECNDIYGPKQLHLPKPDETRIDVLLNLVHFFFPPPIRPHSVTSFVRKGLAGASKQWDVPVFGSVVFVGRPISSDWQPAMYWRCGDTSVSSKGMTTELNSLKPVIQVPLKCSEGRVRVDIFDIDAILANKNACRHRSLNIGNCQKKSSSTSLKQPMKTGFTANNYFLIELLRNPLVSILGENVITQKTKLTFRIKNIIQYPNRDKLDVISLFYGSENDKVKFRIYLFVLAEFLKVKTEEIIHILPPNLTLGKDRGGTHIGNEFIEGNFNSKDEIEYFIQKLEYIVSRERR
jgi:hypothetical protein